MPNNIFSGNEAIALGLIANNCKLVTGYPGTPSSEIIMSLNKMSNIYHSDIQYDWSINEKVALEVVMAASWNGIRCAVTMKQVGLNNAADPFYNSAYSEFKGGCIIIVADDPGCHSSQTEQDTRLISLVAKIPVLEPSSPQEAYDMVKIGFYLSEKYNTLIVLRPTTRICHSYQNVSYDMSFFPIKIEQFYKSNNKLAALAKERLIIHKEIEKKINSISKEFENNNLNFIKEGQREDIGIIASGVVFNLIDEIVNEYNMGISILKIGTPYPLPSNLINKYIHSKKMVWCFEETDACIEMQISNRNNISGRLNNCIPNSGELTYQIVYECLTGKKIGDNLILQGDRASLCPGCPHRSSFYTIKHCFGNDAIYISDIGCYSLGVNMNAIDAFLCMGASISLAEGFYKSSLINNCKKYIVATIGDSTFFHSGIPALINAVHTKSKFILIILDNETTAMTGGQPTPSNQYLINNQKANIIDIDDIVKALNIDFFYTVDPYDQEKMTDVLIKSKEYIKNESKVAIIRSKHKCVLSTSPQKVALVNIGNECFGCKKCIIQFDCPAFNFDKGTSKMKINQDICISCGQCINKCKYGYIKINQI